MQIDVSKTVKSLTLQGEGFLIITNQTGYQAIEIRPYSMGHMQMRFYFSTNGTSWTIASNDWAQVKQYHSVKTGDGSVSIEWTSNRVCEASIDMFSEGTGIAKAPAGDIKQIDLTNLSFVSIRKGAVEDSIKQAVEDVL